MNLSVIIVNYNVKYFLEQCLCAVLKASANIRTEIFVVDNHSTDGSRQYLEPKFPSVKFIWNGHNAGFGKASNSVLHSCTGDYILFLNPDTIIPENCLEDCIAFMSNHPDAGALGLKMIDGSGRFLPESKRNFPTPANSFFKMSGFSQSRKTADKTLAYYALHLNEYDTGEADILSGAFMMLSKKAIALTKGFDEDFFMYGEDVDLSYRIIKAGLKNYYYGSQTIIHFKGESVDKASKKYLDHFYGAMSLFVKKHYGGNPLSATLLQAGVLSGKLKANVSRKRIGDKIKPSTKFFVLGKAAQVEHIRTKLINESEINEITTIPLDKPFQGLKWLTTQIEEREPTNLIFCESELLANEDIIAALPLLPPTVFSFIHQQHSTCIVGSNNKEMHGKAISL